MLWLQEEFITNNAINSLIKYSENFKDFKISNLIKYLLSTQNGHPSFMFICRYSLKVVRNWTRISGHKHATRAEVPSNKSSFVKYKCVQILNATLAPTNFISAVKQYSINRSCKRSSDNTHARKCQGPNKKPYYRLTGYYYHMNKHCHSYN